VNGEKSEWLRQMEPILETSNDGVMIASESGQILCVNPVLEEMTKTLGSEMIGRDARRMDLGAEDYARFRVFRREIHKKGRGPEAFLLPTKTGRRLPVIVSVSAVRQPGASA
jgi:PAS domain S-box-containing protein